MKKPKASFTLQSACAFLGLKPVCLDRPEELIRTAEVVRRKSLWKCHPDHGGDYEQAVLYNTAVDTIRRVARSRAALLRNHQENNRRNEIRYEAKQAAIAELEVHIMEACRIMEEQGISDEILAAVRRGRFGKIKALIQEEKFVSV